MSAWTIQHTIQQVPLPVLYSIVQFNLVKLVRSNVAQYSIAKQSKTQHIIAWRSVVQFSIACVCISKEERSPLCYFSALDFWMCSKNARKIINKRIILYVLLTRAFLLWFKRALLTQRLLHLRHLLHTASTSKQAIRIEGEAFTSGLYS